MKIIQDIMTILQPEEGYLLTDGDVYTDMVFLGKDASPSDWREILIEEVPRDGSFETSSIFGAI